MSIVKNIELENQTYDIHGKNVQHISWQDYQNLEDKNGDIAYFIEDAPSQKAEGFLSDLPTGSISTVNDAAELPLNALKVSVEAWQEGSGDPSPSNIRPIHGWDSGIVNVESKNAVNFVFANDTSSIVGLDFSHTVSSFTLSGTATGGYRIFQLTNLPKIKIGATYTYSVRVSGTRARCFAGFRFYKNGTEISGGIARANLNDGDLSSISFSLNSDYDAVTYVIEGIQANAVFDCTVDVQLEAGSLVTAFTPYVNGKQYTQQFPQTIYGAEWDVVGGEMQPTFNIIAPSYLTWTYLPNAFLFQSQERVVKPVADAFEVASTIASIYKTVNANYINNHLNESALICVGTNGSIYVRDLRYTNASDFKANSQAQILFEPFTLASTIDLSPLSIRLLEGTNNVYADCGEVIEGEYWAEQSSAQIRMNDEVIASDATQYAVQSEFAKKADNACTFTVDEEQELLIINWVNQLQ